MKSSDQKIVSSATLRILLSRMRKISIHMEKHVNTKLEKYKSIFIYNKKKYQHFNQYIVVCLVSVHIAVQ